MSPPNLQYPNWCKTTWTIYLPNIRKGNYAGMQVFHMYENVDMRKTINKQEWVVLRTLEMVIVIAPTPTNRLQ